ncbi:hypothetical protein CHAB381_0982 [Campylobacter hominis ATCC BAA-381]|uniref:Uncharacterized protein n=1 Tax=Campylobacter hominis (strain ATCC BAA-381 / DSM 21671 / CCUG 45161 / LMG 19568 / NCTC 13146 / CH001A) TaxID=360107 RepID=A7I202_CAMHC|nr:hypothetical protein CHAB381_0982 [Campylobacter hominis ATCC BAA-381]
MFIYSLLEEHLKTKKRFVKIQSDFLLKFISNFKNFIGLKI